MTTYTNRVDDGIVKALPEVRVEVRGIEHSAFGHTFVNWKGVSTIILTKRRKCGSYWPQTSLLSPLEVDWIKKVVLSALLETRVSNNNRQEDDDIQILGFIIDFDEFLSSKIFSGKIKLSLKSLQITLSLTKCQKSKACKFQLSTALSTEHGFVFPPEVGQVKLD